MKLLIFLLLLPLSTFAATRNISVHPPENLGPVKRIFNDNSQGYCAINFSNKLVCWGDSFQLPPDLGPIQDLSLDYDTSTCALDMQNRVRCWGHDGQYFQLPQEMQFGKSVSTNSGNICVLNLENQVFCQDLSRNDFWNLASEFHDVQKLGSFIGGVCGLEANNRIRCFNYDPNWYYLRAPLQTSAYFQFDDWATGCALTLNNTVVCFGQDNEQSDTVPDGLSDVIDLSVSRGAACAVKSDNSIVCWKIWSPDSFDSIGGPPMQDKVSAVAAGFRSGCGILLGDQTVKCWYYEDEPGSHGARRR